MVNIPGTTSEQNVAKSIPSVYYNSAKYQQNTNALNCILSSNV